MCVVDVTTFQSVQLLNDFAFTSHFSWAMIMYVAYALEKVLSFAFFLNHVFKNREVVVSWAIKDQCRLDLRINYGITGVHGDCAMCIHFYSFLYYFFVLFYPILNRPARLVREAIPFRLLKVWLLKIMQMWWVLFKGVSGRKLALLCWEELKERTNLLRYSQQFTI